MGAVWGYKSFNKCNVKSIRTSYFQGDKGNSIKPKNLTP